MPLPNITRRPSRQIITARIEMLTRDPIPGNGPATPEECISQVRELAALHLLLRDGRGSTQAAERRFPGIIAKLHQIATEAGR